MQTGRRISIITIAIGLLPAGLEAQTSGDQGPYQDTLQERMQRSVSRQIESASHMQAALNLQRQRVQRQTSDVAAVATFFTLSPPARMAPRPASNIEPQPVAANNDESVEHDNTGTKPEPPPASDAPPAHLMPMIPIANFAIPGIPGIPAIDGMGTGRGIVAPNSVKAALGERNEGEVNRLAAAGVTALRNAGGPYFQQLLQAMGGDGAAALPSPLGPQQNTAAGSYSGRDNAPLTSFSLVDWLFGL